MRGCAQRYHPLKPAGREAARARDGGHRADRPGRVLPDLLGHHAVLPRPRASRRRAGARRAIRSWPTCWASRASTRSATSCCSSASSTRAARRTRTSTSTSPRRGARRSSSTATSATAPSTPGMVCNLVTYRARSAVREVGYALGFPRPLVDRVAKALETYDSVMVRRDLEAEGGFAEFFTPSPGGRWVRSAGRVSAVVSAAHWPRTAASSTAWASSTTAAAWPRPGLPMALAPVDAKRPGRTPRGTSDDEGGPGDTPVSVRWLRREAERDAPEADGESRIPCWSVEPRPIDPDRRRPPAATACRSDHCDALPAPRMRDHS